MRLLSNSIRQQLLRNGRIQQALAEERKADADFLPVVRLFTFTPDANCTWLLTELDPNEQREGLRLFTPEAALIKAREAFFARYPIEAQVVLAQFATHPTCLTVCSMSEIRPSPEDSPEPSGVSDALMPPMKFSAR